MVYIKEIPAMKLELVENWRSLHKSWSVRAAALLTGLMSVQKAIEQITSPDLLALLSPLRDVVSHPYYSNSMLILAASIGVLRVLNQGLAE